MLFCTPNDPKNHRNAVWKETLKVIQSKLPGDARVLPTLDQANCDLLSQVPKISPDGWLHSLSG